MEERNLGRGLALAFLAFLLFFVVQYGVLFFLFGTVTVYRLATGSGVGMNLMEQMPTYQIWITLLSTIVTVLLLWGMKWLKKDQIRKEGMPWNHAMYLALTLIGMSFGCSSLLEFLQVPDLVGAIIQDMITDPWGVLAISVVGPIGEEVLFRGAALQKLMDKGWSPTAAIWISSLLFGIAHMNPVQIIYATVLGLLLGWVYVRTKSLLPCIGLHIFNNLTSVVLSLVSDDPNATYVEMFGTTGALMIMVVGLASALLIFGYMRPRLKEMN